jgi:hypothetical protein
MALGGVPYYLDYVRKGKSAAQTIDTLFFAPNAPLLDEFDKLFAALFDGHERHVAVIRALARKQSGLSRDELIAATGMASGGTMTAILQELETSGFIAMTTPFGRTARDCLYRLIDELTLFHIRWIDGKRHRADGESFWAKTHSTPTWHAWSGYAFENLCLKHVAGIKKALGISGVQTDSSAWRHAAAVKGDTGAQIDLLIDRRDGVINVCEMKFCDTEYTIDKKYSAELRNKLEVFRRVTGTRKTLFMTMVTPYGVKSNEHRLDLVQNSVTMDALFD